MSVERNNELYPAVCAGDAIAREAMICENMGLVIVKAETLISQIPGIAYLRDDLVSAGNIGLVEAVNKLSTGRIRMQAVNKWIGRCILKEMHDLLPHERCIHIDSRSSRRAYQNGQPINPPTVFNILPETLKAHSDAGIVDLRDVIVACCKTENERECLRLKEEGYKFREIGPLLSISPSVAYHMFRKLKARILAYWTRS